MTSSVASTTPSTKRTHSHMDDDNMADAETFARHVYGEGRTSEDKQGPTPVDPEDVLELLTQNPPPVSAPEPVKARRKSLMDYLRRTPKRETGMERPGILRHILRWLNLR